MRDGLRLAPVSREETNTPDDGLRQALGLSDADRPVRLPLGHIRMDGGTQPRAKLDDKIIREYADDMINGAKFPPVDVFYDGEVYWLADGFHRWNAALKAELRDIETIIHQGTRREAVLFSVSVNAEHGFRRTNEDKRRAAQMLLGDPEWCQWSDREIARHCKVHHSFVSDLRNSLSLNDGEAANERVYTTKHGTQAVMNTEGIKAASKIRTKPRSEVPRYVADEYSQKPPEDELPAVQQDETEPYQEAASPMQPLTELVILDQQLDLLRGVLNIQMLVPNGIVVGKQRLEDLGTLLVTAQKRLRSYQECVEIEWFRCFDPGDQP